MQTKQSKGFIFVSICASIGGSMPNITPAILQKQLKMTSDKAILLYVGIVVTSLSFLLYEVYGLLAS